MLCFQSVGIIFLLLSQGASKQIRRRRNIENNPVMKQSADQIKSIIIKLNGVLVLTISDYRNYSHLYYEYMKFCLHLDNISYVSTEMVSYNNTPKHFKDSNTDTLLQQKEKIFSAFKEFISTNIDEFLKTQCLKSVGEAIRHADDSLESMEITRWRESQNLWIMQNIPEIPFTKSYDVQINVQIYGVPTFTRIPKNNHTLHFELCRRNGSTIIDYVSNYKDPKTDPILLEGKEVARVYNEAISNDFNQLLKDYLLELNVEKSVPVNNTEFLEEMDSILENRHDTPGKTLHELDQLSLAWAVQDRPVTVVKDDVAVVVPDKLVRGLRVSSAAGRSEFEKYSFDFLDEAPSPRILRSQESEIVVTLPPSALTQRQVSFVVFQKESLFPSQPNGFVVNSLVISVNIKNVTHFHGGEVIDIHFRPIATPGRNESRSCAYWHFLENNTGYWSQEGCNFIRATEDGMLDTCRCNHLTHFAEILVPKTVFSEANERALEILTIAGCSLSIMGLIIVGATALLFRSWRQEFRNKIWLQMCMAILILVVTFLVVIFVQNDRYHMKCLLLGVTLHYAVLASFCWMLVAAVLAYRQLVLVFARDVPHKLFRATVFAWGAPGVVCGVLLSVSSESYAGQFQEMTPGGNFCYPKGLSLWLAVYAPISVILVTNWTLLALILRSLFCSKKIRRYGEGAEALRSVSVSCKLGFLFGLPWVFGLFASNVVAAYLFTLTATFQGFVSFVLLVIGNKKTRELWANKMFKKRNIMPMALVRDSDCSADSANQNGRDTAVPILYYTSTR